MAATAAATPAASPTAAPVPTSKSIKALVVEKMAACRAKAAAGETQAYDDYSLYFSGARDFVSALGGDVAPITSAMASIQADLDFIAATSE